jgi:hypothetical protein
MALPEQGQEAAELLLIVSVERHDQAGCPG